jgi:uncharacterized protein YjiS (DUF1127 family)
MFRLPPNRFVKHDDVKLTGTSPDNRKACKQRPKGKDSRVSEPTLLRDDHIVLLAIDGLLALHAAVKRYVMRRRTRKILSALDDGQLRDIGLTRYDVSCQKKAAAGGTGHLRNSGANS